MWVCVHIGMPALILHAEVFVEWFICDFVSGLVNMQAMMDLLVFKEFGDRANLALARRAWALSHSLCLSRQWGGIKYIALAIMTEGWKWESVLACSSHCIALLHTERAAINCHTMLTPNVVLINMCHSCLRRQNVLYPSVLAQVGLKMERSNSLTWKRCLHLT